MHITKTLPTSLLISGLYGALFALLSQDIFTALWLALGLLLGYATLIFDEVWLFRRYADANKPFGGGLITRSIPFMAVFLALSVFVITSSASLIGIGVIIAMGTLLCIELWRTRNNREQFVATFTPLHPEQFPEKQRQQGIAIFITVFAGLLCWALMP